MHDVFELALTIVVLVVSLVPLITREADKATALLFVATAFNAVFNLVEMPTMHTLTEMYVVTTILWCADTVILLVAILRRKRKDNTASIVQ